jgi:hypothetical protein
MKESTMTDQVPSEADRRISAAVHAIGELVSLLPHERRLEALEKAVKRETERPTEATFETLAALKPSVHGPDDEIRFSLDAMSVFAGVVNAYTPVGSDWPERVHELLGGALERSES